MAVTTYRCTGCKPIDTKIIEAYLALISTNESISAAESARERVSSEDHEASVLATQRANAAAEAAENAVANVGKFYGFYTSVSLLPSGATEAGYALVGETSPFEIWEFDGTSWSDSGTTMDAVQGESAYEVAVDNGYVGTEEQWVASLKGDTGDAAGFGTVQASVDANVGTPSVTVTTSGPDTAKNFNFAFSNMKGATGATGATPDFSIGTVTTGAAGSSASATITGTAAAPVLNLTIPQGATGNTGATGATGATPAFSIGEVTTGAAGSSASASITGTAAAPVLNLVIPKGDQGNTGSSVDYPYELVNNRTTDDATKGLSAAEGKRLGDDLTQLELEVHQLAGKYYGIFEADTDLPEGDAVGYAFVGTTNPFSIYQFDGEDWADSGATVNGITGEPGVGFDSVWTMEDGTMVIVLTNGDTVTVNLNHGHDEYYSKVLGGTQPVGGFLPDVVYSLGTLSGTITFSLASAVTGNVNHYFWMFDTGSTAPTITWPAGLTWAAGAAPVVAASKHYEVSVLGGIAYYSEV